jgi:hypothetical protein
MTTSDDGRLRLKLAIACPERRHVRGWRNLRVRRVRNERPPYPLNLS